MQLRLKPDLLMINFGSEWPLTGSATTRNGADDLIAGNMYGHKKQL